MMSNLIGAIDDAVAKSLEGLGLCSPTPLTFQGIPESLLWSWVKVIQPWPATLVLAIPAPLALDVAGAMIGGIASPDLMGDAQAELTNIFAGAIVRGQIGSDGTISLGIPRVGRGCPDIQRGGWLQRTYQVGELPLLLYWHAGVASTASPRFKPATPATLPTEVFKAASVADRVGALPRHFGEYEIIAQIGEGGMGQVYQARHITLNRLVALKAMRPEFMHDQEFIGRFMREARAAALIDHENVVEVYDAGVEAGSLYIAMRFVTGGDLAHRINRSGRMTESEVLPLLVKCLYGVQAISACGMVHRDIKPANILLETDGTPRLGDLGLARTVDRSDNLSRPGVPQGTPCYMSPEQARGQAVDIRADLYSLGASIYTALSGKLPFTGDTVFETVAMVLTTDPIPLRTWVPTLSTELESILQIAMAKDPRQRYPTAAAFLEAVHLLLEHRQERASHPTQRIESHARGAKATWIRRMLGGSEESSVT